MSVVFRLWLDCVYMREGNSLLCIKDVMENLSAKHFARTLLGK